MECVPNFSEGKRMEIVNSIRDAAQGVEGITILDCEADPNHNRMVLTFVGSPDSVKAAALAASAKAIEQIDLTKHSGEHPRMGAVDVVPFVPLREVSVEDCVNLAREFGQEFATKFSVPVYLYEHAATSVARKNLADVRDGQFEVLRDLIGVDPSRDPDFGPKKIHPTAGATAVGARPILIAYNVDLGTQDISIAKKIARRIRERDGGFPSVKALGFQLKDRKLVQVSMNLTDYTKTSMHTVFDAISSYAKEFGVGIVDSEIVGLVPMEALAESSIHYLSLRNFDANQIIENRIISIITEVENPKLINLSLQEFSESVSSTNPVPGGGSVSAYAGAMASSLVVMVSGLTIGRKNYEGSWEAVKVILHESVELRNKLLDLVDQDAKAYGQVVSAMKLPKITEHEKFEREKKIQLSLRNASEVPSDIMLDSYKVLQLAKRIREIGNRNAISDSETAAELARASVAAAWSNVKTNLGALKDGSFVEEIKRKLQPIIEEIGLS
ncbi:MAG: glutamate formimidoyltransferase [Thaumarchaeota archaeon]|nr:glutamate formimidoyltransferase [Nitrososphaerota archaeon]